MFDFNRRNNRFMNNGGQPSLGNFGNTQNRQNSYGLNNMSNGQPAYNGQPTGQPAYNSQSSYNGQPAYTGQPRQPYAQPQRPMTRDDYLQTNRRANWLRRLQEMRRRRRQLANRNQPVNAGLRNPNDWMTG